MASLQEQLAAAQATKAAQGNGNGDSNTSMQEVLGAATETTAALSNGEDDEFPEGVEVGTLAQGAFEAMSDKLAALVGYSPVVGDYKDIRCHSIITSNGNKYEPNKFGYYEVEGLPKAALDLLEYFEGKGLVEKVEG